MSGEGSRYVISRGSFSTIETKLASIEGKPPDEARAIVDECLAILREARQAMDRLDVRSQHIKELS